MTITRERRAALREDAEASSPDPYAAIVNGPELIELLDMLDEAESARDQYQHDYYATEVQVQQVRDLHGMREEFMVGGDCATEDCEHEHGCPTRPVTVCDECWRIAEEATPYFAENDVSNVFYPCATIRALDGTGDEA